MAQMIPRTLDGLTNKSPGEKKTFNMLSKLPDEWYVWCDMEIGGLYPDFVLLDPKSGILILEVKDWSLRNIVEMSKERFTIKTGGPMGVRIHKHPLQQARDYSLQTIRLLQKKRDLVHQSGDHKGKLTFTWSYGCVFPNIKRKEFDKFEINDVSISIIIDAKKTLFKDSIKSNKSKVLNYVKDLQDVPYKPKQMTKAQFYLIRQVICPDTVIPDRTIKLNHNNNVIELDATLDPVQEQLAKSIGEGHRLLNGVAGSGKTLIMLYRAKLISKLNPDWKVLFLCWNVSLGSYLRQMFDSISIDGDYNNAHVTHFMGWMRHLYKENGLGPLRLPEHDDNDRALLKSIDRLNEVHVDYYSQYQAIFIDEAQDFLPEFFLLTMRYLDRKYKNLVICSDEAQNVMGRTWKSLGIKITKKRTTDLEDVLLDIDDEYSLSYNYRNTQEIMTFASCLYDRKLPRRKIDDTISYLEKVGRSLHSGPRPELAVFKNREDEWYSVAAWIKNLHKSENISWGEILVVFPGPINSAHEYAKVVFDQLEIPYYLVAENQTSKANLDLSIDIIKISTVASAKGMDFKAVAFVCADLADFFAQFNKKHRNEPWLYTAVTRARKYLYVTVKYRSPIEKKLFEAYYKAFKEYPPN